MKRDIIYIYRIAVSLIKLTSASDDTNLVEQITRSPGIFFDPVGTLKIVSDYMHIVIPIDISFIHHHVNNIKNVFGTVRFHCQQSEAIDNTECHNMIQPLDALFKDITRDVDSLSHLVSTHNKRSAWFSGVGTVFKHIFGTLNEDDASKYNDAIHTLFENDKQLVSSVKESIVISKSAISNFNQSLNEININEARLNDVIDKLTFSITNITQAMNDLSFRNNLAEILNVLYANLLTLSFKIEDIINSVLFVKSNTLHPSIVTPKQLFEDIKSNIRYLPKYKDFPISLDLDNIHVIINLSELISYFVDDKLVFILKIPLVHFMEYNLYKSVPIPTPGDGNNRNSSYSLIIPSKLFIALSKDKTSYCNLNSLNDCKPIVNHVFLCEISDVSTISENPSCEVELMTRVITSLPIQCNHKNIIGNLDIWQPLNNNKWLFTQTLPVKISIECNSNIDQLVISGTGILNIHPNCIIYCKSKKLLSKQNPKINIVNIHSDFNIIEDKCCNGKMSNDFKSVIPSIKVSKVRLSSMQELKELSDNINSNLNNVKTEPLYSDTTHITFSVFSVVTFILCLCLLVLFVKRSESCLPRFSRKIKINETENTEEIEMPNPHPRLRIQ